jgi:hypothetical protein
MLRIPYCLDSRFRDGGKVVSPTHQPHFTPQKHYYFYVSGTHFCWRLSKPQGLVWLEGLGKFKNSPDQILNPRPSSFKHSALTNTLPRAPYMCIYIYIYIYIQFWILLKIGGGRWLVPIAVWLCSIKLWKGTLILYYFFSDCVPLWLFLSLHVSVTNPAK